MVETIPLYTGEITIDGFVRWYGPEEEFEFTLGDMS